MIILTTVVAAAVLEELLYRGLIYNRIKNTCGVLISAIISSLIFGAAHWNPIQFIYGFIAGMVMCYVYEKYRNLWAPIILHMSANLTSVLVQEYVGDVMLSQERIIMLIIECLLVACILWVISRYVNRIIKHN